MSDAEVAARISAAFRLPASWHGAAVLDAEGRLIEYRTAREEACSREEMTAALVNAFYGDGCVLVTTDAERIEIESRCARCLVNPSQSGSSLCDPCETGLEVAREEGSAAASEAARSRASALAGVGRSAVAVRTADLEQGVRVFVRLPYCAGTGYGYVVDTRPGAVLIDWESAPSSYYARRSPHWITARSVVRVT